MRSLDWRKKTIAANNRRRETADGESDQEIKGVHKMKCVAAGDIFITPEMMRDAIETYGDLFDECRYFYFGLENRKAMRDIVKIIERGGREECELPKGLMEAVRDADVLMVHLCPVTRKMLSHTEKLKYILCNRGGVENVDVEAAAEKNIWVMANPAHNANAVAEFTVGLIFSEIRNISRAHYALKGGEWREKYPNFGRIIELKDLTVGIVGFGNIGELVCEKLSGFGCQILISSPWEPKRVNPRINWDKVRYVDLDTLIAGSDIISLHVRSEEKKALIGEREFEMMKRTAYLINTSRSYMVDNAALYKALSAQQIEGAAVDVFDKEPLGMDDPFLELDNITLTNHRAGDTLNAYKDSPEMMLTELAGWLTAKKLPRFLVSGKG